VGQGGCWCCVMASVLAVMPEWGKQHVTHANQHGADGWHGLHTSMIYRMLDNDWPLQLNFDNRTNIIVDLTHVDMPCNGTYGRKPWDANKCGDDDTHGWYQWLMSYTTGVLKIDISKYRARIMIMPVNNCGWWVCSPALCFCGLGCCERCGSRHMFDSVACKAPRLRTPPGACL
jgi:hypothetical protein